MMLAFAGGGAILGAFSSISGAKSYNKALIENYKQQAKAVVTNYNYNQKQFDLQEQSLYTSAQARLQEMSINSMQNNATVMAALNETGYEGRNAQKVAQSVEGQTLRQQQAVKDANEVDVLNIRSQKEALYIQTNAQLENMRNQTNSQVIGKSEMLMSALGGAATGAAMGAALGTGAEALMAANAAPASMSWGQAFTEAFSVGFDANAGLFAALGAMSTGMNSLAPSRRGY